MKLKRCAQCRGNLGVTAFGRDAKRPDGLNVYCRGCVRSQSQASYVRNIERQRAVKRQYAMAHREDQRERSSKYYRHNRDRVLARTQAYRVANPHVAKAAHEKWSRLHPEAARARYRRYRLKYPEKAKLHVVTRRERLRRATVGVVSYRRVLARDGFVCHICGGSITPGEHQFDHVVPLARGGRHCNANIAVAHALCNARKQAKTDVPSSRYPTGIPQED